MDNAQKLTELRKIMEQEAINAFLMPHANEYQAEFPPACAQRLAWLTGFTGSAGMAVVTQDSAMVMSDGRYTLQLQQEVDSALFSLENSQKIKLSAWLADNVPNAVIGYDPRLFTMSDVQVLKDKGITLKTLETNPIDQLWTDRPLPPTDTAFLFSDDIAGRTAQDKINLVQKQIGQAGAKAAVFSHPETAAWLLNIRGSDVPYTPLIRSKLVVPTDGVVKWYGNLSQITSEIKNHLSNTVVFYDDGQWDDALTDLANQTVLVDPKQLSAHVQTSLEQVQAQLIEHADPCIHLRACKVPAEQEAMKNAHIRDGVAVVKFLKWFEETAPAGQLDELSVEIQLEDFRREAPEFVEPSFPTIAGFGGNGAIVHYRATDKTNKKITKNNLLLLDSGAQYVDGTTDITRTISIGKPTAEMVLHNTLVLKGHVAVATATFGKDVTGKEIDVLARQFLKAEGLDFAHGTGHGVGCYLSVHEEATSISPREEKTFQPGMIISNEPGYYKENEYGIRIENLILVQAKNENDFFFETITLVPFDTCLIDSTLLTSNEKKWINEYHTRVLEKLSPYLDEVHQIWLQQKTAAI